MFSPPASATDPQPDWARPLFERQVALLGRLAEAGLEIALAIERQAKAAEPETGADTAATRAFVAYARVARAVRLTLMLQAKVIKQLQALDSLAVQTASGATARDEADHDEQVEQQKARLERIVGRIAERQHDDPGEIERLLDETAERLDHDDLYGDVLARPTSDLIALICQDLGLDPGWATLAQEAWAREEIADGSFPLPVHGERLGPRPSSPPGSPRTGSPRPPPALDG